MPSFASPTDGARLHYTDYGPAGGPAVVFLSSSYFGTEMWEHQTLPLASGGLRCVALDRRGHGRSDDVWDGFDLDTLADDVGGLLDHLNLRNVTLVGHSVGAAEAVRHVTRQDGGRVARLALVSGVTPGLVRSPDNPDGWDPAAMAAGNEEFRKDRHAFFDAGVDAFFAFDRPGNELSASRVRYLLDRIEICTARAGQALGDTLLTADLAAEMTKLRVPVLIAHGTHDTSAPLDLTGRRAAELAPRSTLRVYENAGHGLFVTHAEQLTADLRTFATEGA
ncbi:chloroperoxidase [Streptomyces sp. 150FB]|uniref:alpha/beta fold hydrolase n=1 Tax=Streptomyces sp. 150FB TaxID=1576605 RepID=UPI000588FCD8|nr:alpha/beta hydrolase [Streptomyces sp. 150FB]KIF76015.1 chloroperoxidase [Streptomyces sp. 150FB]